MISTVAATFTACSSDDDDALLEDLVAPEYNLPTGKPGTVDATIKSIYDKYGTYILYDFKETDFRRKWNGKWTPWYAPANTGEGKKYVERIVNVLNEKVLNKYEPEFVRRNFPYKVFLVDTLCKNSTYSKRNVVNVLSNGYNAIAVSNVGKATDEWGDPEWKKLAVDLEQAFTLYYYSSLTKKPLKFISLRFNEFLIPTVKDPTGKYDKLVYSCYSVGYVMGKLNAYLKPDEDQDFADFVSFIAGTDGTELKYIFSHFEKMKERGEALYRFMKNEMDMDLIKTQNSNFPDDKLPENFFE